MSIEFYDKKHQQSIDFGCCAFRNFRVELANRIDPELGKLYSDIIRILSDGVNWEKDFREITKHPRFKGKYHVLNFLLKSDCEGQCSPRICNEIYVLMRDYTDGKDLLSLMKYCHENNIVLRWY
jgi:hypothetical protein